MSEEIIKVIIPWKYWPLLPEPELSQFLKEVLSEVDIDAESDKDVERYILKLKETAKRKLKERFGI